MELKEVQEFFETNKDKPEVQEIISSLTPTPSFEKAMDDPDFQKSMKRYTDSAVSKAVEAYKEKGFKSAVEQGIKESLEAKAKKEPWQIELEEVKKTNADLVNKFAEKERSESKAINKTIALKALSDKKLPTDLLDFLVSEEEEKTQANIESFATMMESYTQNIKQEILKSNNVTIPGDNSSSGGTLPEPGLNASKEEWKAYYSKVSELERNK